MYSDEEEQQTTAATSGTASQAHLLERDKLLFWKLAKKLCRERRRAERSVLWKQNRSINNCKSDEPNQIPTVILAGGGAGGVVSSSRSSRGDVMMKQQQEAAWLFIPTTTEDDLIHRDRFRRNFSPSDAGKIRVVGDKDQNENSDDASCVSDVTRELQDIDAPSLYPSLDTLAQVPDIEVIDHKGGKIEVRPSAPPTYPILESSEEEVPAMLETSRACLVSAEELPKQPQRQLSFDSLRSGNLFIRQDHGSPQRIRSLRSHCGNSIDEMMAKMALKRQSLPASPVHPRGPRDLKTHYTAVEKVVTTESARTPTWEELSYGGTINGSVYGGQFAKLNSNIECARRLGKTVVHDNDPQNEELCLGERNINCRGWPHRRVSFSSVADGNSTIATETLGLYRRRKSVESIPAEPLYSYCCPDSTPSRPKRQSSSSSLL